MKPRMIFLYGILLLPVCVLCAMVWHWQMAGTYFISKHAGIILDAMPPFIHPGEEGDLYIKPVHVIYTIWSLYAAAAVIIPGVLTWLAFRWHDRDLKNSWT